MTFFHKKVNLQLLLSKKVAITVFILLTFGLLLFFLPSVLKSIVILILGTGAVLLYDNSIIKEWLFQKFAPKRSKKLKHFYNQTSELLKSFAGFCAVFYFSFSMCKIFFISLLLIISMLELIRSFRYSTQIGFCVKDKTIMNPTSVLLFTCAFVFLFEANLNKIYIGTISTIIFGFALFWIVPFFIFNREYKRKFTVAIKFIVLMAFFSYGAVCSINRVYDFHPVKQYETIVADKLIKSGAKSKNYLVGVLPIPNMQSGDYFGVDATTYEKTYAGDHVYLLVHQGALGASWYELFTEPNKEYEIQKSKILQRFH